MTNLWSLVKIEFSKSFSKTSIKENKAKSSGFFTLVGFVVILGIALSSLYSYIYGNIFKEAGMSPAPLVVLFAMVTSLLTLFSGITQSKGIFTGKDYDMLSALPLKKSEIIASKVINLYLVELLYSAIIMIPNGVVFYIQTKDIMFLYNGFILAIFISAFPLVVSMLFAFLTSMISEKFKYGNLVSLFFYILLLGASFSFSFFISKSGSLEEQANIFTNISSVAKWFNPSLFFVDYAVNTNYAFILIFIAINVISVIVVILVISLFYDKIHEVVFSIKADYKYERKQLKTKKQLKALLELEFRRLISSKLYFINSVIGLIMAIIMSGFLGFTFSKVSPFNLSEEMLGYVQTYAFAGAILVCFGIGITNTCAVAISIEGQNFWLVKSLPLDYKKYMWAKLLLSLILMIPVSLICSTLVVAFIQPNWVAILSIYLIPILYSVLNVFLSLLVNLRFYKLKWRNEQEVVKSSSAVVISMLLGFATEIVLAGLLIGLGVISSYIGVFVSIGVLLVAGILFFAILNARFESRLMKIEDF